MFWLSELIELGIVYVLFKLNCCRHPTNGIIRRIITAIMECIKLVKSMTIMKFSYSQHITNLMVQNIAST